MIPVTPLAGGTILINADIIEAIETDPNTVIVLANGRRMIVTDDPALVTSVMEQFDRIWMGEWCTACQRRDYCPDPIA